MGGGHYPEPLAILSKMIPASQSNAVLKSSYIDLVISKAQVPNTFLFSSNPPPHPSSVY